MFIPVCIQFGNFFEKYVMTKNLETLKKMLEYANY